MLVLSRNEKQGIKFPGLGVSVEILEVAGSKVKVGVDAPIEVRVLRDELLGADDLALEEQFRVRLPNTMRHELRNALNEISLGLRVYLKRVERGEGKPLSEAIDAENMFQAIIQRLENVGAKDVPRFGLSNALMATPDQPSSTGNDDLGAALVVDDDDNERELLAGFLRMCGYHVDTANDGLEAEEFLRTHPRPRFILLDMCMPRCNGSDFLMRLRTNSSYDAISVFVVSGSPPTDFGVGSGDYTHWFDKPLDPRRIVETLARIERSSEQCSVGSGCV